MSKELLYYSSLPLLYSKDPIFETVPGIAKFRSFVKCFEQNTFLSDRTGRLTFPFKVRNSFPLPEFNDKFNLSFRECAAERMADLDRIHQRTGKRFRLLYSGGIDSSGIFSAFVDYYGVEKTREVLEICCSKESIDENPWLWDRFIRKENFDIITSHDHNHYWNDNKIMLMGEGNDHLWSRADYTHFKTNRNLYNEITVEECVRYLNRKVYVSDAEDISKFLVTLGDNAPIPITNMASLIWWINFSFAWNGVIYRVLGQARSMPPDTLDSGFFQFYNTDTFQQWSLKYHYDCADSFANAENYKIDSKNMVIDILNIPEYKDKGKFLSFPRVHLMKPNWNLIDTDLKSYKENAKFLEFVQSNSFE